MSTLELSPEVEVEARTADLPPVVRPARLASLDAFRGLTILGMLLVNNLALDADTPRTLTHAPWNGDIHLADLVFPWFLLIVGVAIPYSYASIRRRGERWWSYVLKAVGRAVALFFLGCLLDSSVAKQPVLGLGVLQLIGLAYLCGALVAGLPTALRLVLAAALLAAHWYALRFIAVPGVGAGVFTEADNLVAYLNRAYLQPLGLKGLISAVPTTAMVLIGSGIGELLRRETGAGARKALLLAGAGMALTAAGCLWSLDLPFNKPVWTAPYIVVCAGLGALMLAILYALVDVRGWRRPAFPLVVFGSNAIVAYVLPILVKIHVLQEWTWPTADGEVIPVQQALLEAAVREFGRTRGGWAYTGGYILCWWLVLFVLYRKQLFLRV